MAQSLAFVCGTSKPGTMRSRSGMLIASDRRISSCVMTKIVAAARESFSPFFDSEVTSMFIKSSILRPCKICRFLLWPGGGRQKHREEQTNAGASSPGGLLAGYSGATLLDMFQEINSHRATNW